MARAPPHRWLLLNDSLLVCRPNQLKSGYKKKLMMPLGELTVHSTHDPDDEADAEAGAVSERTAGANHRISEVEPPEEASQRPPPPPPMPRAAAATLAAAARHAAARTCRRTRRQRSAAIVMLSKRFRWACRPIWTTTSPLGRRRGRRPRACLGRDRLWPAHWVGRPQHRPM